MTYQEHSTSALVLKELERRYPDKQVPYGAFTDIASDLGVTRELARQVAQHNGFTRKQRIKYVRVCSSCSARLSRGPGMFCPDCVKIPVACDICGTITRRYKGQVLKVFDVGYNAKRAENGLSLYSGERMFCSHACFGKWAGKNGGWGNPNHPSHNRPPREPKHGTYNEYVNYKCRCALCKEAQHERYVARKATLRARTEAGIA